MDYHKKYFKYKNKYINKMTGAGNLDDACRKYKNGYMQRILPVPVNTENDNDLNYEILYNQLLKVDDTCFLILKIGSNDSDIVKSGKQYDPVNMGSMGKEGHMFIEIKSLDDKSEILFLNKNKSCINIILKNINIILRATKNHDVILKTISPIEEYEEYWYPFGNQEKECEYNEFLTLLETTPQYIKGYFPIGINNNKCSNNYKILYYLANRAGPLFLFNAMGSWCYQSIKYIIDTRVQKGLITFYGGLVDDISNASCEINTQIYPDLKTKCLICKKV